MARTFNKNIFESTYNDDFRDSDNFHRILFNNARALQARELTQMQTITQREIERLGRHFFKDGAAVNPGGVTINNGLEYIKLDTTVHALPDNNDDLIGTDLTSDEGVIVNVIDVLPKTDTDPATLYVNYINTSAEDASADPIRVKPGTTLTGGAFTFNVQATNQAPDNLAVGQGTKVSILAGDFFAENRFVYAGTQSKIISRYTTDPTTVIGFKSTQDIVTANDDIRLFDNSGSTPNKSAPGADRYRIRLTIAEKDELEDDENFVYIATIVNGQLQTTIKAGEDYRYLEDRLATRTFEESGDYIVDPFEISFNTNADDADKLDVDIGYGISYVKGYRAINDSPLKLTIDKPRTSATVNNEAVPIEFGNYLVVNGSNNKGFPNVDSFQQLNIRSATNHGGSTIGTARALALEEHTGSNYKLYLFDIQMNSGEDIRDAVSLGTSTSNYMNIILESNKAVLKDISKNFLLFPVPGSRPKSVSDVIVAVQRRFSSVTVTGGAASINATGAGETFVNLNDMIISTTDGTIITGWSASGAGSTTVNLTGLGSVTSVEILAYVNKSEATHRSKTLTNRTDVITPDGNDNVNLGRADIYKVNAIRSGSSTGNNISNRYTIDNGQRDTHYGLGRLILKPGMSAPAGDVYVDYDYFAHSTSGDYFAVNSYDKKIAYEDIPTYEQRDGTKTPLREVIDFRSVVNTSGTFGSGAFINEMPQNTDVLNADIEYYQGKAARITIDVESKIEIHESDPDFAPELPDQPTDTMNLFDIQFNPYLLDDEDMVCKTQKARRWTMQDITRLSKKVDRLEEVTSLSLLEVDTNNLNILDADGNTRTKSGIFVDNFADHRRSAAVARALFPDHNSSIDRAKKIMRPSNRRYNLPLVYRANSVNNSGQTGVVKKGDSLYLAYTHTTYEDQPVATETENVNPFAVVVAEGLVELSPASDDWIETKFTPRHVLPTETNIVTNFPDNWNNWLWGWAGGSQDDFNQAVIDRADEGGGRLNRRTFTDGNFNVTQTVDITGDNTVERFVENKLLKVESVPFMRSKKLFFRATGLKPNTRVFCFFDNVNVADWVRPETFQFATDTWTGDSTGYFVGNEHRKATEHPEGAGELTTNSDGTLEGSFFIPSTKDIKFRTGTREFMILDISKADRDASTSYAMIPFTSTGIIETRQPTFSSTRTITVRGSETRNRRRRRRIDPLAQTFMVEDANGVFITRVGVRFATKDSAVTVVCQIRPTVNGVPSADDVVPNAVKVLAPSSVNVPSVSNPANEDTVVTYFEFDEPVFLNGNQEYAVVLLSDSTNYNAYVAKAGEFVLGTTEKRVTKQPTMGSLFKSQNGRTWTPDQSRDLTFELVRARFQTGSKKIYLENARMPKETLDEDPFTTDGSTSTVQCFFPGHGFQVNDVVNFSGATGFGGISASNINGDRTVTKVDWTGFEFTAGATSTEAAIGGGDNIKSTRQMMYNLAVPQFTTLRPNGTVLNYKVITTTGKSLGGNETAYQRSSTFAPVSPGRNNYFNAPQMIANKVNEDDELNGLSSLEYEIEMTTSDNKVSPIIDLQRCSQTMVENVIDNQTSSSDALNYLAETNSSGGSLSAKHITQPVSLEIDAVGIKVFIAASKPSVASFDLYYRTNTSDTTAEGILINSDWTAVDPDALLPSDENPNQFREYEYTIGGDDGTLTSFDQFQLKIVMKSTNSSKVPVFRDIRAIAMTI